MDWWTSSNIIKHPKSCTSNGRSDVPLICSPPRCVRRASWRTVHAARSRKAPQLQEEEEWNDDEPTRTHKSHWLIDELFTRRTFTANYAKRTSPSRHTQPSSLEYYRFCSQLNNVWAKQGVRDILRAVGLWLLRPWLAEMLLLSGWAFERKLSFDHMEDCRAVCPVCNPKCPTTSQSVQSTLNIPWRLLMLHLQLSAGGCIQLQFL